jgi:hypothetical protein
MHQLLIGLCDSLRVQSSSDAGDELDASSLGIAEEPVLAGIARSQRPASIVPTAVRAAEGEVVNLRHNSVTARPARCRSSRKGASRESASRHPKHRRDKWRCWLSLTESSRPPIGEVSRTGFDGHLVCRFPCFVRASDLNLPVGEATGCAFIVDLPVARPERAALGRRERPGAESGRQRGNRRRPASIDAF